MRPWELPRGLLKSAAARPFPTPQRVCNVKNPDPRFFILKNRDLGTSFFLNHQSIIAVNGILSKGPALVWEFELCTLWNSPSEKCGNPPIFDPPKVIERGNSKFLTLSYLPVSSLSSFFIATFRAGPGKYPDFVKIYKENHKGNVRDRSCPLFRAAQSRAIFL